MKEGSLKLDAARGTNGSGMIKFSSAREAGRAVRELETEVRGFAPFSRASLLAAAELGRDAVVQSILQPAKGIIANAFVS